VLLELVVIRLVGVQHEPLQPQGLQGLEQPDEHGQDLAASPAPTSTLERIRSVAASSRRWAQKSGSPWRVLRIALASRRCSFQIPWLPV
jgi:hypothetical protein